MAARWGQGHELSETRARIARKAQAHADEAFDTIVELMRSARRETVRFDASMTVLELAETGGEGMEPTAAGEKRPVLLVVGKDLSDEIARRVDAEREQQKQAG